VRNPLSTALFEDDVTTGLAPGPERCAQRGVKNAARWRFRAASWAAAAVAALGVAVPSAASARAAVLVATPDGRLIAREDPFAPAPTGVAQAPRTLPSLPPPGAPELDVRAVAAAATPSGRRARAAAKKEAQRHRRSRTPAGVRAVLSALARARERGHIDSATYRSYRDILARARSTARRLGTRGVRGRELAAVLRSVEALALRGRLIPSRLAVTFLELRLNERFWRSARIPAARAWIEVAGSELLFAYFPGQGVRFHPLGTFKRANAMHAACVRPAATPCERERLWALLDEARTVAVRRSRRFRAFEYMFAFGGGRPPWISAMATATALQAYARTAQLTGRDDLVRFARSLLGAFAARPPLGVRTTGPRGGVHYLQYSFAPRLFIFNAFTQAVIGLHDFAQLTADKTARARFEEARGELAAEIPASDLGDWSLYSWRGRASTPSYHELLRELLAAACTRRLGAVFCDYAERYRAYQTEPPRIEPLVAATARSGRPLRIRFRLSKLSVVELRVVRDGRTVLRRLATFARGTRAFSWRPTRPGKYRIELAAKELRTGRALRGRADPVTVQVIEGDDERGDKASLDG